MRLSSVGALATCIAGAVAFKSTSPFFLFSTAESPTSFSTSQLQSGSSVIESTKNFLGECSTDNVLIIQQSDMSAKDVANTPLAKSLKKVSKLSEIKLSASIWQVIDGISGDDLIDHVHSVCESKVSASRLKLPAEKTNTDITALVEKISKSYTVIYVSTPKSDVASHPPYEPEFQESLHVELKRQSGFAERADGTETTTSKAPLFVKYQFFTPGLFMGLLVSLLLLAILSVALRAVSSLSVSYGAFDKEMGPAAQRKQQ